MRTNLTHDSQAATVILGMALAVDAEGILQWRAIDEKIAKN
ncbi:hypothetical protein [Zarconia navalis]|nr:hypothetical protein [Zarconia navalis]